MQVLRRRRALSVLAKHRETFYTKDDFRAIKRCGLNSVRLPFGCWVVLGPRAGEPYEGPALEYVDRAVSWAEELGLEVLLDLHGAPGGESGSAPSGHQKDDWHWSHWRFRESLEALRVLAERYCCSKVVTGIAVCNEPSKSIPARALCRFYDNAVDVIRGAGMHESHVAVTLPCFQRDLPDFAETWKLVSNGRHKNICFDLHHYYCFGSKANGRSLAEHLRLIQLRGEETLRYPVVVGEWSLALGDTAARAGLSQAKLCKLLAGAQTQAYSRASHGFFFWCWKDRHSIEWSYKDCRARGLVSGGPAPEMPPWDDRGPDPLDRALEPPPRRPGLCYGDIVHLRGHDGRLVSASGGRRVEAQSGGPGPWQQLVLCPGSGRARGAAAGRRGGRTATAATGATWGSLVREGDSVVLLGHNGAFIAVRGNKSCQDHSVVASKCGPRGAAAQFTLERATCLKSSSRRALQHRDRIRVRSSAALRVLEACAGDRGGLSVQPWAAARQQTWRDLAKESEEVHSDARQAFTIELSKQQRFSKQQTKALVSRLVAAGRRCRGARQRARRPRPEEKAAEGFARKRRWHGLLARSATKRQRLQLKSCLPESDNHA